MYSRNQSSLGGKEISGLKLATVLRLKRNYHCRITDVWEDYDLRVIISKNMGGYIVKQDLRRLWKQIKRRRHRLADVEGNWWVRLQMLGRFWSSDEKMERHRVIGKASDVLGFRELWLKRGKHWLANVEGSRQIRPQMLERLWSSDHCHEGIGD